MSKRIFFKTFGCRTNQFDTQIMINSIKDKNFDITFNEKDADIIIVNSCTVTNGADSSIRWYINKIKRENPSIKVILAGCGAFSKGEELYKENKVFGVIGHSNKSKIEEFLKREKRFLDLGDLDYIDETIVTKFLGKSRAFIKIEEGCDFKCSYCIIPAVRGRARSIKKEQILEQISILASNGFGEFILTGTNVGSYGKDINYSIAKLIKDISKIRGVRRIRVGSLEPIQIDEELIELLDEEFFEKHLHIALQHTSDKMLEIMNRRNRFKSDLELFEKIALKGVAIGTDFIVGHPGESKEIWQEAIERIKDMPLTHIHIFSYSPRDNTLSALMKDRIKGDIVKLRQKELRDIIDRKNFVFRKKFNKNLKVLVEEFKNDNFFGYDQYYNKIAINSSIDLKNSWIEIEEAVVKERINEAIYPK